MTPKKPIEVDRDRRSGDADTKEARDIAVKALHLIESHSKECATLQARIEKQQDEIRANQKDIATEVTEINVRAATMATIQKDLVKTQGELATKFDAFGDRLGKVEVRLAIIVTALFGASKLLEHFL